MPYYTVPRIGTGTVEDPFRPELPTGTTWVGNTDGVDFLVTSPADLPDTTTRTRRLPEPGLRAAAEARGFVYEDVAGWSVRSGQ